MQVKAKQPGKGTGTLDVAFHEIHPDHPGGEALVTEDNVVEVAETARVKQAIEDGILVEVAAKKAASKE